MESEFKEKFFYVCNGMQDCRIRKDGKKNEYCMKKEGCFHTADKNFAKYKSHKSSDFDKMIAPGGIIFHVERVRDGDNDSFL